jgi:hypothetical protein
MRRAAMTAINLQVILWIIEFDDDEPIVDERQCRCVPSRYIQTAAG